MIVEHGCLYMGGPEAVYDLPEDEQVSVLAYILTRDAPDGWANTCAPMSPADHLYMLHGQPTPAATTAPPPASKYTPLADFQHWAAQDGI